MAATKGGAAQAAPHHAMAPRKGEPNETYSVIDARGVETKVIADSTGRVEPQTTEQVRVADAHNLPTWSGAPAAPEPSKPAETAPAPMTLAELKTKAGELGLVAPAKAKKAELEALIAEAEAAAKASEEEKESEEDEEE